MYNLQLFYQTFSRSRYLIPKKAQRQVSWRHGFLVMARDNIQKKNQPNHVTTLRYFFAQYKKITKNANIERSPDKIRPNVAQSLIQY